MLERSSSDGTVDPAMTETAWLEVVRKMDETYTSLVHQQVELEEKNRELESAQAFIASILGAMTDVLIICDRDQTVINGNAALERALGRKLGDVVGRPLADLVTPAGKRSLDGLVNRIRSARLVGEFDLVLQGAEGGYPLSVNASALTDSRGRVTGTVLVGRSLGELRKAYADLALAHENLKRAQQRMIHAEKMASLGRLVAGVAHEINNPMSFVYGNSHALRRYCERLADYLGAVHAGDAERAEAVRRDRRIDALLADLPSLLDGILEGAERTRDIVESLRRYASGHAQSRELVDLVPLVHTATRWVLKGSWPDLRVEFDMPERLEIVAHSGALQQVVMNLVQNAIDAMLTTPEPHLEISAAEGPDEMVRITVRDHGSGIPEQYMSRLLDPFFTTKPVGKGTGLGLSICDKIIADHGGHLSVANAPDGGALFSFTLPTSSRVQDGNP